MFIIIIILDHTFICINIVIFWLFCFLIVFYSPNRSLLIAYALIVIHILHSIIVLHKYPCSLYYFWNVTVLLWKLKLYRIFFLCDLIAFIKYIFMSIILFVTVKLFEIIISSWELTAYIIIMAVQNKLLENG